MKLTEGRVYITRDGRSVGPMVRDTVSDFDGYSVWRFRDKRMRYTRMGWHSDGKFIEGCESNLDLVRTARKRA